MSRVVLRGASGRMPWAAPRPQAPAATQQQQRQRPPVAQPATPASTPPPAAARPRAPPRRQPVQKVLAAPEPSVPGFDPWSDARCAKFLKARAAKLTTAGVDAETAARGMWQYFFRLSQSKAVVGPETRNALVTALCRVGAVDDAAKAVDEMQNAGVGVLPDAAGEVIASYAACGQHHQAIDVLRFFTSGAAGGAVELRAVGEGAGGAPSDVVGATFGAMERHGTAMNPFSRALLEHLPGMQLAPERAHFVSVAKTSPGGRSAYEVLSRMRHLGHGDIQGSDVNGSLAFACGQIADAGGAEQIVKRAERVDQTNTTCYEGLALGHRGRADVKGSGDALDRFNSSGHDVAGAAFLLQTVAATAAPQALQGDRYAKNLCYKVYDTAMAANIEDKRPIASILQPVVQTAPSSA